MITATPEYLLNVVDEETAERICDALQGFRIYFPTSRQKIKNIIKDYERMKKAQYTHSNIIENLSNKYDLSKVTIKKHIKDYEAKKKGNV